MQQHHAAPPLAGHLAGAMQKAVTNMHSGQYQQPRTGLPPGPFKTNNATRTKSTRQWKDVSWHTSPRQAAGEGARIRQDEQSGAQDFVEGEQGSPGAHRAPL
jgi:hypothetical protein